jgi:hypothetical protein
MWVALLFHVVNLRINHYFCHLQVIEKYKNHKNNEHET